MWKRGGAKDEDPQPYLKTVVCRVVSISALVRTVRDGDVRLSLHSLPKDLSDPAQIAEPHILKTFLDGVGEKKPQLVGFNTSGADLPILIQRAVGAGIACPGFGRRPAKPWEGPDYFASHGDYNIDLLSIVGGYGKARPSLHEMLTVSGIPAKIYQTGLDVAPLWLDGRLDRIVAYNEADALSTYLLWLRVAHFGGHLDGSQYIEERSRLRTYLVAESERSGRSHLRDYLAAWRALDPAAFPP
jgi:predicted PolB exonuclease-like 3'-5' exonuclease